MTLIRSSIQIHWPKKGKENKKSDPFFKLFRFLRPPLVAAPAKRGPIREPLATDSGKPQIPEGPKASAPSPVRFPACHSSPSIPHSRSKKGIPLSQSQSLPISKSLPAVLRPAMQAGLPARLRPAMQAGLPVRLRPAMQAGPRLQAPKSHRLRRSRPQVSQHTTVKNRPLTLSCLQQAYCCAPLAPRRRRLPVATHPPPTRVSRAGAGFRRCFRRGGWRGGARSRRG